LSLLSKLLIILYVVDIQKANNKNYSVSQIKTRFIPFVESIELKI